MDKSQALKAGDPCPQCGGAFVVDHTQAPDRLIATHKQGSQYPEPHARYRERVLEKVAATGLVHRCTSCGYQARFPVAVPPAAHEKKGKAA